MRKLRTALLVASFVSMLGICCSGAGAQTVTHAETDTHVTWEQYRAGWTWDQNRTFVDELRLSLKQFFGNAIGAYFDQSPDNLHPIPLTQWSLISTQFLGYGGSGTYSRGTILDDQWELYEFFDGTTAVIAWVTPINSTRVVAAAITHRSCGFLALKDTGDSAAFEAHFDEKCDSTRVTIFFKDKVSYDKAIRDVLIRQMSQDLVRDCSRGLTHTLGTDSNRFYVETHGHQPPPCRIPWDVVTLDEFPKE